MAIGPFWGIIHPSINKRQAELKVGGLKITWYLIGKIIAGIVMIVISFVVFKSAPGWVKIIVLAALVLVLLAPQHLFKKKMPAELEKALKSRDKKGGYG